MRTFVRFVLPLWAFAAVSAGGDAAGQAMSDEVLRELAALRAEVRQLREELDAMKAPAAAAAPSPEIIQGQLAELAQTKVESTTRFPLKIFGTIHAHAFSNSATANWLENPNLVGVPVTDPGTFSMALRQTRIGFTADGPTLGSVRTSGVVAFDFFGGVPGFQTGQVMGLPRLLVAYARFQGERAAAEIGQDHMVLAPRDPTSLSAFSFPLLFRSGNLYLRTPQARLEYAMAPLLRISGGIAAPIGGDLPGEDYRFVPPPLGGERSRRPAFQARAELGSADAEATHRAAIGVSGHFGWERRLAGLVESRAMAVDFGARFGPIGVAGEAFAGENIDAFGGALGLDAPAVGGWAEVQLIPSSRVSFNLGAGLDDIDDTDVIVARRRNRSAYGNVIFSLTPEVQASFEYRWVGTLPLTAAERRNHHFDWVLTYKF
jgi:hypothetical protein